MKIKLNEVEVKALQSSHDEAAILKQQAELAVAAYNQAIGASLRLQAVIRANHQIPETAEIRVLLETKELEVVTPPNPQPTLPDAKVPKVPRKPERGGGSS